MKSWWPTRVRPTALWRSFAKWAAAALSSASTSTPGNFKNWAIPQAAHRWVLIVDADERVTPELAAEIKQTLAAADLRWLSHSRRNHFFGHEIKHCGWNTDDVLRLFRRDLGRYNDYGDHAEVEVSSGKVGRLKARLMHYTYWSMEQYLRKLDRYTGQWAQQRFSRGRRASYLQLLLRTPLRFFYLYFIRLGFLDGVPGLVVCLLSSFYSFTKVAKLWAAHASLTQPDPECRPLGEHRAVVEPLPAHTAPDQAASDRLTIGSLVSGPSGIRRQLVDCGCTVITVREFADHQTYSIEEVDNVLAWLDAPAVDAVACSPDELVNTP